MDKPELTTEQLNTLAEMYAEKEGVDSYNIIEGCMRFAKPEDAFLTMVNFLDLNIIMGLLEWWQDNTLGRYWEIKRPLTVNGSRLYRVNIMVGNPAFINSKTYTSDRSDLIIAIAESLTKIKE